MGFVLLGVVFFLWLWFRHTLVVAALYAVAWLAATIYVVVDTVLHHTDVSWFERIGWGFAMLVLCAILGFPGLMFVMVPETVSKPRKKTKS